MKRRYQDKGELDWAAEDLLELQAEPLSAIDSIFKQFGNVVISGCKVTGNTISDGVVVIDGTVMPFVGTSGIKYPCYITASKNAVNGCYIDGIEKPIAYDYKATISPNLPSDANFITVSSNGTMPLLRTATDTINNSKETVATSKALYDVNENIKRESYTLGRAINELNSKMVKASDNTLGLVKAKAKTTENNEVAIDRDGKLYTTSFSEISVLNGITTAAKTVGGAINELDRWKADTSLSNVNLLKSYSANGYWKGPDGFMIQWGVKNNDTVKGTISFPLVFTTCFNVLTNTYEHATTGDATTVFYVSPATNAFTYRGVCAHNGVDQKAKEPFYWIAIGTWK